MYAKILVALENSAGDRSLLPHVAELAKKFQSQLLLVHVADGWVARNYDQLRLVESPEMKADREYLEQTATLLHRQGLPVTTHLALGEPAEEILKLADQQGCELIAMTSHGHRFVADLLLGSTIHTVRHRTAIPVLLVRAGTQLPGAQSRKP